jgi:hypothetical protein
MMAKNTKKTSPNLGTEASAVLRDPNASKIAKSLAGSALAQTGTGKQTGAELEDKAAQVLDSDKYSDKTKSMAGSVLSQSNKKR